MPKTSHIPKDERDVMTLALSHEDKKALKMMAVEQDISVALLIHNWIQEHLAAEREKDP